MGWQWRMTKLISSSTASKYQYQQHSILLRRLFSTTPIKKHHHQQQITDEGDWCYSREWWGTPLDQTNTVFRDNSTKGNGVVSVLGYQSTFPGEVQLRATEEWLSRRCWEVCPDTSTKAHQLKLVGYQWRVLRFNDETRQSVAKVMAVSPVLDPRTVYLMQQGHCLAMPYVKSMVSAGLTTLSSCNFDLMKAVEGDRNLRVLCIGHGGGSLPLFLASKIQGAVVDIVEIDPVVISASIQAMGFPSFPLMSHPGHRILSNPNIVDHTLWGGLHERLFLYEADASDFIVDTENLYDIIFIDAYNGKDIFPRKLWDPDGSFLKALGSRLHPHHGTVVVNLHSDSDTSGSGADVSVLPMGKYVSQVCRAYKDVLFGNQSSPLREQVTGLGFAVSVPYVCNTTLVVCRGFEMGGEVPNHELVLNTILSNSVNVDRGLDLPFSCVPYLNGGFALS